MIEEADRDGDGEVNQEPIRINCISPEPIRNNCISPEPIRNNCISPETSSEFTGKFPPRIRRKFAKEMIKNKEGEMEKKMEKLTICSKFWT